MIHAALLLLRRLLPALRRRRRPRPGRDGDSPLQRSSHRRLRHRRIQGPPWTRAAPRAAGTAGAASTAARSTTAAAAAAAARSTTKVMFEAQWASNLERQTPSWASPPRRPCRCSSPRSTWSSSAPSRPPALSSPRTLRYLAPTLFLGFTLLDYRFALNALIATGNSSASVLENADVNRMIGGRTCLTSSTWTRSPTRRSTR